MLSNPVPTPRHQRMKRSVVAPVLAALLLPACVGAQRGVISVTCDSENVGLTLRAGFCASVFADSVAGARHLWSEPNGDVFVAAQGRGGAGGVWALRDSNHDGKADERVHFASGFNSSEVTMFDGYVYAENITGVLRFPYKAGSLEAAGRVDTVVSGLPSGGHQNKTFTIDKDGSLYVNDGSPTNSCQEKDRAADSPGKRPCTDLDTRAGVWKWDARKLHQTYENSAHFAKGIRNAVGIAINPLDGKLWATQHGRDGLGGKDVGSGQWSFSVQYNAENPAEELLQV